jgi:hypothetical protein
MDDKSSINGVRFSFNIGQSSEPSSDAGLVPFLAEVGHCENLTSAVGSLLQHRDEHVRQRNRSRLVVLRLSFEQVNQAFLKVHGAPFDSSGLTKPDPAVVEERDEGLQVGRNVLDERSELFLLEESLPSLPCFEERDFRLVLNLALVVGERNLSTRRSMVGLPSSCPFDSFGLSANVGAGQTWRCIQR